MKKVTVKNLKTNSVYGDIQEDPTLWIEDCVLNNYWGKPVRWIRDKLIINPGTEKSYIIPSEEKYDEEDVLEREIRKEPYLSDSYIEEREIPYVKLQAEYTIKIEDISEQVKTEKIALISKQIDEYLQLYTKHNFKYNSINFNGDRDSCVDVNGILTLKSLIPKEQLDTITHSWRKLNKTDKTDQAYIFNDFNDFKNFAIQMGLFYEKNFQIRSSLKDSLDAKTIDELIDYDVEFEWNSILSEV